MPSLPIAERHRAGCRVKIFRRITGGLVICAVVAAVFVGLKASRSTPDIRGFDPEEMGRLESAMWKSYYEGRWASLGRQTVEAAHKQYGFSWWDSLHMGIHAARAALYFRRDGNDPRCLPELESYYAIIRRTSPHGFDVPTAAALELEWWRERRRHVAPQDYARTMAKLAALIYSAPEATVLPPMTMRAETMAYRDERRDGKMTGVDWEEVSRRLTRAYSSLKSAVASPP